MQTALRHPPQQQIESILPEEGLLLENHRRHTPVARSLELLVVLLEPPVVLRLASRNRLFQLIELSGVKLTSAQHTVNAVLADPMVAPLLGVDIASPLLSVNELIFDQEGQPVEYVAALYRPDRFNYKVNLAVSQEQRSTEPTRATNQSSIKLSAN